MKKMINVCVLSILLTISYQSIFQSYADDANQYKANFLKRVGFAEMYCLLPSFKTASITFDKPSPRDESYDVSSTQSILYPIQNKFFGLARTKTDRDEQRFYKESLINLGIKTGLFAASKKMNTFEATCLASCVVNQILQFDERYKASTQFYLSMRAGLGNCTHFAKTTEIILQSMGIDAVQVHSWNHSFIELRAGNEKFLFEPQDDGRARCNFMRQE